MMDQDILLNILSLDGTFYSLIFLTDIYGHVYTHLSFDTEFEGTSDSKL
jgi:hypothetical protein